MNDGFFIEGSECNVLWLAQQNCVSHGEEGETTHGESMYLACVTIKRLSKYVSFDHCTEQQSKKLWLVFFGFPDYASDGSIIVSL